MPLGVFSSGLIPVKRFGTYGFMNHEYKFVIPETYDYASSFAEHMAIIGDGHFGHYSGFFEGLAGVYQDTNGDGIGDKMGYIDSSGNVVLDFQYEAGGAFRDGKAVVIQNKIRKTIDRQGKEVESKTSRLDPEFFPKSCKLEAPY